MPTPDKFLRSFGFVSGAHFDGYTLEDVSSTHETISRYQEYRYDITLTFANIRGGNLDGLFDEILKHISYEHIVKGIRNPYRCIIDQPYHTDIRPDKNGNVTVKLTGHAYRE
jgi:hypothetical protein